MQPYQIKKAFELAEIFQNRLQRDLYCGRQAMQCEFASCLQGTPFAGSLDLAYRAITLGEKWGEAWQTGYFRFSGCFLPPPEADLIPVCQINTGSEALLYDVNGKALSGLTAFCWFKDDFVRDIYYPAAETVEPGRVITYYCAVTANKLAGLDVNYDPPFAMQSNGSFTACLQIADTLYLRKNVQHLIWDIQILRSLASTLREQDYRRRSIARALDRAENVYADNPANAAAARSELQALLALPACSDALTVTAVGHSHLDTAYMWPIREGIQKCGRTFATQLELIEN
jgi:alpha-mannosidase